MASARYWRLWCTANNGSSLMSFAEVQFRSVVGTPEQATGGTPSASSQLDATWTPAKAFDGLFTDPGAASASSAFPWWIKYDFGSAKTVNEVAVYARGANPEQTPLRFLVQGSPDDVNWTTYMDVVMLTGFAANEQRRISLVAPSNPATAHKAWRVWVMASQAGGNIVINDLQLRGSVGGAAQTGGEVYKTVEQGGFAAVNAFDGNTATAWAASNNIPAGLGRNFFVPTNVEEVWIRADNTFFTLGPSQWRLEYTDDYISWYPYWWWPGIAPGGLIVSATWTALSTQTFSGQLASGANIFIPKIGVTSLVGSYETRLAVSNVRVTALSGSQPSRIAVSNIRVTALVKPVTARLKAFPQIIGG